ncbi:MAG: long-chain fatty acid--CoA ligase, partial [Myxococcaceae bacterium]|nr:long-chain fatty acid--CoA ligase [Myxococcaceae bacterium]
MASPKFQTLVDIYTQSTRAFGPRELFGEKKNGTWTWTSYARFGQMVDDLRGGLAQLGVGMGDRVAVISNNRVEWAVGCYATATLGAAYVPMYEAQQAKEWQYILNDCGAKVVLCATDAIARTINGMRAELPKVEH